MKDILGTRVMDAQIWISKLPKRHARKLCVKYYPQATARNLSLFHWCEIYEKEFNVKLEPMGAHTIPTDYMKITKQNIDSVELLYGTPKNVN